MKNKFQYTLLFSFLYFFITLPFVHSQNLMDENFNYPLGDSLGAHGWVTYSGGASNVLSVTSPGLVYPGYPLSNIGLSTTLKTSGQDAYKYLSSVVDSTGANGTSVYLSFMANVTSAQTGDIFIGFFPQDSIASISGRVLARFRNGNLNFGITKVAATDTNVAGIWTTGSYSLGTTYLIILKYTFISGLNNDQLSLFVGSAGLPPTEPTPTIGPVTFPSLDPSSLSRVALRQGSPTAAPLLILDGIRVARTWAKISSVSVNTISSVAQGFSLSQNYPNPFNPETKIEFSIPADGFVKLTVYNSIGKEVKNLVNESLRSGTYSSNFNGNDLNSGVYFYRIDYTGHSENYSETKKLILIK